MCALQLPHFFIHSDSRRFVLPVHNVDYELRKKEKKKGAKWAILFIGHCSLLFFDRSDKQSRHLARSQVHILSSSY